MTARMVALLAGGLLVAGCGSSGGSQIVSQSLGFAPGTYVGTDYNSATMLTITRDSGGHLTGTMTAKNGGENAWSIAVNVSVSGDAITLTYQELGSTGSITGTIQGPDLHLGVPQQDGTVEDYVLKPGTVDDYNADVHAGSGQGT